MASNERVRQLLDAYPAAITDFYGSGTLCLFKSGPAWPLARGWPNVIRAARPIYDLEKEAIWLQTAQRIVSRLDSLDVEIQLTAVDPLAYANAGEATLICNFVVVISVRPNSLSQRDAAGTVAPAVLAVLEEAGLSDAQVAVVESEYRRQAKFMPLDPNSGLDSTAILRKPFTLTPGLSIAPHDTPSYEGTGGVFMRLSSEKKDKCVYLLTCAHVARPPPLFENVVYTHEYSSQRLEKFVLHGTESYGNSIGGITQFIDDETTQIAAWQSSLDTLPAYAQGEPASTTVRRDDLTGCIAAARRKITAAIELHDAVTKNYTSLDSRIFGHLHHRAKIEVGDDGYMYDWALILVYEHSLEAGVFQGNKLFVGGNKTAVDWQKYMFPQRHDRHDFHIPLNHLLQLDDYIREEEFLDPKNRDVNDANTLLAVKNGRTTGTTFGRVNGLKSITRNYDDHGLKVDAIEVLVLGYDTKTAKNDRFSEVGDSGSMVADRRGRLIGLITGGRGQTDKTAMTYITPYYSLKKKIEAKFGEAHLLSANFDFLFA